MKNLEKIVAFVGRLTYQREWLDRFEDLQVLGQVEQSGLPQWARKNNLEECGSTAVEALAANLSRFTAVLDACDALEARYEARVIWGLYKNPQIALEVKFKQNKLEDIILQF